MAIAQHDDVASPPEPDVAVQNETLPVTLSAAEEARGAMELGIKVIPVPRGSKRPTLPGWPGLDITEESFPQYFDGSSTNVAVLNGERSGNLVDIDLDHPTAIKLAPRFLPTTGCIFGRESKPRSHWVYFTDRPVSTSKFDDPTVTHGEPGGMISELRSTGASTNWIGSRHPSGEDVVRYTNGEPARVSADDLVRQKALLDIATLLGIHWPSEGRRDNCKLPLAGALASSGLSADDTKVVILAAAEAAGDEEADSRISAVDRTFQRRKNGETTAGYRKLAEFFPKSILRRVRLTLEGFVEHVPKQRQAKEDFYADLASHKYIHIPTGMLWPASSVRQSVGPIQVGTDDNGDAILVPADVWLDQHRPVHQRTWAPGYPPLIEGRVPLLGGWTERADLRCFNDFRPATVQGGDPTLADLWIEHVQWVYPRDADHLIPWFACRVQHPEIKINHALVLGGAPGIGKDTLLYPVKLAVGPWNVAEVSPTQVTGRFNGFLKSVLLIVSEARDRGEVSQYGLYEHMKTYTASPPEMLRCDEKFIGEYPVPNVCGVIYTTNHRDGLYLREDDRRHYVAWSGRAAAEVPANHFATLYRWYDEGGAAHVAAYLASYDLSTFDPKAPPPKTAAFHAIVDANRAPEDNELADAIDALGRPDALTIHQLVTTLDPVPEVFDGSPVFSVTSPMSRELAGWLLDRRNARQVPHRLESAGYIAVGNPAAQDRMWKVGGKRAVIYGLKDLAESRRLQAAQTLAAKGAGS